MNDIIAAAKIKWAAYAEMKRAHDAIVYFHCRKLKPVKTAIISLDWYEGKKRGRGRDFDNIVAAKKFIFDGLVLAGVIKDDSPKYIAVVQERIEYRDNFGVKITIKGEER
jgi:Holliday junction resolvase RusA-like endonuclease